MIPETIIQILSISTIVTGVLIFVGRIFVKKAIESSIQHEFNVMLEQKKIELGIQKLKKWELKRDSCLLALDLVNAVFSHRFKGEVSNMVIEEVDTVAVRRCMNQMACSIDNPEILVMFKKLVGIGDCNAGEIVDFRNLIRKELEFGKDFDDDRKNAFFTRIIGDSKKE